MASVSDAYYEQIRKELEELFAPARALYGESFRNRLSEDEELLNRTRERYEHGEAADKFPLLSEFLSPLSPLEKEAFFKTGGKGLESPKPIEVWAENSLRLHELRLLLGQQVEFETRYPAAFEILFPDRARSADRAGMYLPSFGIYVPNHNPLVSTTFGNSDQGGDAYSHTYYDWADVRWRIKRGVWPVHQGFLQGLLLAILSREEYVERIEPYPKEHLEFSGGVRVPHKSPIRITDLRLATVLKPGLLRRELGPLLGELQTPITAERVAEWKRRLLSSLQPPTMKGLRRIPDSLEDSHERIVAISFASAALWLFLDLDMPGVRDEAPPYWLAAPIADLAEIVRKLVKALERATEGLDALAANRGKQRPPGLEGKDYWALRHYRMGHSLREIAEGAEITPYNSKTRRGTKNWTPKVKRMIANGKKVEDKLYPRAAAIIANQDNPHVRHKACRAYRFYVENNCRFEMDLNWPALAREIRVGSIYKERGHEIAAAYLQLGSCIEHDIDPLP